MNIYSVYTPDEINLLSQTEIDPAEYGQICEVVAAPTPGKAKAIVCNDYNIDFIGERFSVIKLGEGDYPVGFLMPNMQADEIEDYYAKEAFFIQAATLRLGDSDIEEWARWESTFEIYGDFELPVLSDRTN